MLYTTYWVQFPLVNSTKIFFGASHCFWNVFLSQITYIYHQRIHFLFYFAIWRFGFHQFLNVWFWKPSKLWCEFKGFCEKWVQEIFRPKFFPAIFKRASRIFPSSLKIRPIFFLTGFSRWQMFPVRFPPGIIYYIICIKYYIVLYIIYLYIICI